METRKISIVALVNWCARNHPDILSIKAPKIRKPKRKGKISREQVVAARSNDSVGVGETVKETAIANYEKTSAEASQ